MTVEVGSPHQDEDRVHEQSSKTSGRAAASYDQLRACVSCLMAHQPDSATKSSLKRYQLSTGRQEPFVKGKHTHKTRPQDESAVYTDFSTVDLVVIVTHHLLLFLSPPRRRRLGMTLCG